MRRKIPSTGALIAFEAAARHQSFTKAALELSLTQGAVCRQIAGLESFLGVRLFRRTRQGVKLTEAGVSYGRQIAARLDEVERDTLSVMACQGTGTAIELAVVPSFATKWLLPRLPAFLGAHVDTTVNMETRTRPFLFGETRFDAAIHCGEGAWPGTQAHLLMREYAIPVCSPRLLGNRKPIAAGEIAGLPLLQQSTRPYAWRQWFSAQGLEIADDMRGPRFELFSMLAQAATNDMGVALIPPMLIEDDLAAGRLVAAGPGGCFSDKAYYLIYPDNKSESGVFQAFRVWLCAEAADYRVASGL